MMLGMKRNIVELVDHDPEWERTAAEAIRQLWLVLGSVAKDIQHVGSTSIHGIKAKPIIDIAVDVDNLDYIAAMTSALEANGFMRRNWFDDTQLLYAISFDAEPDDRITTHYIHIAIAGSNAWSDYVNFRDYMNAMPNHAKAYEALKERLATENPIDLERSKYIDGKRSFIIDRLREAQIWLDFGRMFTKARR